MQRPSLAAVRGRGCGAPPHCCWVTTTLCACMKRDCLLAKGHWTTKGAGQIIATTWKPLLSRSRHDHESLAPQRGGTRRRLHTPSATSHVDNSFWFEVNPLLIEDPEGNKVRSVDSPQFPRSSHTLIERNRGARETRLRPDAHGVAPRAPCRGQGRPAVHRRRGACVVPPQMLGWLESV